MKKQTKAKAKAKTETPQLYLGDQLDGKPWYLPLDPTITETIAIMARKGSGKTHTATVLVEELLSQHQQVVVIDPTGAWSGLKSSKDGKSEGFPVTIFGGDHADVPIEGNAGEIVAEALVASRASAVLDLTSMSKGKRTVFAATFLEVLFRRNRQAMHLVVDEADSIAPQRPVGETIRSLGALEDVVKRGRRLGIGCTLIAQRPSDLAKQVLTQCSMLIAMRLSHQLDIKQIEDWVGVNCSAEEQKRLVSSLPSLERGTGWVWDPVRGLFEQIRFRERTTFDSSATPKAGEAPIRPKVLAKADVAALGEKIAALTAEVNSSDPKKLRAEIAQLQAKLAAKPFENAADTATAFSSGALEADRAWQAKRDELQAVIDRQNEELQQQSEQLAAIGRIVYGEAPTPTHRGWHDILQTVETGRIPAGRKNEAAPPFKALQDRRPAVEPISPNQTLVSKDRPAVAMDPAAPSDQSLEGNSGLRRMLIALTQRYSLTKAQIGLRADMKHTSGTFNTYLGRARSNDWVTNAGDGKIAITAKGLRALGSYTPLPEGEELLEYWVQNAGGGAGRILAALRDQPLRHQGLSKAELGELTQMSHKSGTFNTYLGRLRTLELVEKGDPVRLTEDFR